MTTRGPSPSAQLTAFISRFPPQIVAMSKKCLPKLRRALPGANQIVYDYANSVVVSFSMSERGYEAIVAIAISAQRIQLYFDKSIPDPKGLLEGAGSKVRSVTVNAASELDHGDIHALIKAAIKNSGVAPSGSGKGSMIIQSESKKKKPRKAVNS